jgi:hypothetical protein
MKRIIENDVFYLEQAKFFACGDAYETESGLVLLVKERPEKVPTVAHWRIIHYQNNWLDEVIFAQSWESLRSTMILSAVNWPLTHGALTNVLGDQPFFFVPSWYNTVYDISVVEQALECGEDVSKDIPILAKAIRGEHNG